MSSNVHPARYPSSKAFRYIAMRLCGVNLVRYLWISNLVARELSSKEMDGQEKAKAKGQG
jgi:hypothetical protein